MINKQLKVLQKILRCSKHCFDTDEHQHALGTNQSSNLQTLEMPETMANEPEILPSIPNLLNHKMFDSIDVEMRRYPDNFLNLFVILIG